MKSIFAKIPALAILGLLIAAGTSANAQGPQNKGKSAKAIEKKEVKGAKAEKAAGAEEKVFDMEKEAEAKARGAEKEVREAEKKAREAEKKVKEAEGKVKEAEHQVKEAEERVKELENEAQGNAYGKNKGDLSGRDFGQARSDQAKLNNEGKLPQSAGLSSADAEKEARLAVKEAKKAEKGARKAEKSARKAEKKAMKALKAQKEKMDTLPGGPLN